MAFFRCDLMSESLGMTTSVLVTMPDTDDLDTAPIIYLLHGLTDNCTGWARYTQAEHLARTHSAILIMPEVQRSFYTDMACGPKYFTYVNQELQAMVRRFFGIQPNPARTYIMGLSMGGYGALKCALTAPQQYAGAAGFSSVADIKAKLPTFSRNSVHDGRLVLNTRQTRQEYRLLILPAGKVISAETLKRIKEFYDKGGRILATGQLPVQSAEFGRDTEITALIGQIFGIDPTRPIPAKETSAANKQGGRAIFVPAVTRETLRTAIARLVPSPDVRIPLLADMKAPADSLGGPLGVLRDHPLTPEMLGMFSYIHKQKEGRDIYLFANSTNRPVDTWVEVRGKHRLDQWDPYTGEIVPWPETETVTNATGEKYTRLHLTLDPVRSVFAVSR